MRPKTLRGWLLQSLVVPGIALSIPGLAFAQTLPNGTRLPGPADATRIKPDEQMPAPPEKAGTHISMPGISADVPVPANAENIKFTLNHVTITGNTAFTSEQLADIYEPYVGKEISLATAYKIAAEMTQRYRNAGYFLSLVTVPNQSIQKGELHLKVSEGYIGEVEQSDPAFQHYIIRHYIDELKAEKPIKMQTLESILLRLNDMPGVKFRAVLSTLPDATDGAVKLTLLPSDKAGSADISFDNFNSRYLGPYQATGSYTASIIPFEQTTISGLNNIGDDMDKLSNVALLHSIPIWDALTLDLEGDITNAAPGYTLEPLDIHSRSTELSAALDYQWIRSRRENLSTKFMFDARDTKSDALGVKLTNDIIRALRASVDYDTTDSWQGYNKVDFTVSQGIDAFGTQDQNPLELSRAGASPTFSKFEFSLARLQQINPDWSVLARTSGQIASGTLYSAEQFGYGGQSYGRAYDPSEILGDDGIDGSIELRYDALNDLDPVSMQPFAFYDAGLITNYDSSEGPRQTAASAGGGMRFTTTYNQFATLTAAFPIGHEISAPLYGESKSGPRFSFQVDQKF